MTRYRIAALFVCSIVQGLAVPAIAQPAPPPGPACLQPINFYSFQPVPGNRSLVVTDRARKRYRLTFMGPCYNLDYHLALRFKTFGLCARRGDPRPMRHQKRGISDAGPGPAGCRRALKETP